MIKCNNFTRDKITIWNIEENFLYERLNFFRWLIKNSGKLIYLYLCPSFEAISQNRYFIDFVSIVTFRCTYVYKDSISCSRNSSDFDILFLDNFVNWQIRLANREHSVAVHFCIIKNYFVTSALLYLFFPFNC